MSQSLSVSEGVSLRSKGVCKKENEGRCSGSPRLVDVINAYIIMGRVTL